MYLYNVTIIAENDISGAVRQYIDTQFFDQQEAALSMSLLEMLDSPHEGTTYCLQLRTGNDDDIRLFQQQRLRMVQESLTARYPGKIIFFESIMKYLND